MGFQLAHVDDGVHGIQPCRIGKAAADSALGVFHVPLGEILVEPGPVLFRLMESGGAVDPAHKGGIVKSAGAVTDDDFRAALGQQLRKGAEHHRMGGAGGVGFEKCNQIGLESHTHTGAYPVQAPQGGQQLLQRLAALGQIVCRTGNNRHIHGQNS